MPIINNDNSRLAGVIDAVSETWQNRYPVFQEMQNLMFHNVPYTNIRNAEYVWKEALPFPKKWDYGRGRTYQTFLDRLITCRVMPFELSIPFNLYDERDDQLQDVRKHVSKSVERFHMISDRLFSEYLNGARSLNDRLEVAYDGGGLFSATQGAGGAPRLGVAGGNIVTGSGTTPDAILADVATVQARLLDMQDEEGQPFFTEADVDYDKLVVIGPNRLNESLQKASKSEFIKSDPANITSESNYQVGTWQYKLNPYLTNQNDLYVVVNNDYWKPFIHRSPDGEGIRSIFADFNNSDRARNTNEAAILTDVRIGLTPWFVGSIVKINNS